MVFMRKSTTVLAKKRRGPKPTGKGVQVVVRMQPNLLSAIDSFVADQPSPKPSRPEAVRSLAAAALVTTGYLKPDPEDG